MDVDLDVTRTAYVRECVVHDVAQIVGSNHVGN